MFLLFNTALKKLLGYSILVSFRKPTYLRKHCTSELKAITTSAHTQDTVHNQLFEELHK